MPRAKMTTKEIDLHAFHTGIFVSNADFLSPVAIYAGEDFQTLQNFYEITKDHPSQWMTYAGPAGIGQYSLKKGPVGILAKFVAYFRHPTKEEMENDFQHFGEQVLGPSVKEVSEEGNPGYKNHSTFKFWGEDHYFTGPPRLFKSVFVSRVFPSDLPEDVSELANEVDGVNEKDDMIVPQGYQFVHAKGGKMQYMPFERPEDYHSSKLEMFGSVELENGRMTYYPKGDKKHPIDFTSAIHKNF